MIVSDNGTELTCNVDDLANELSCLLSDRFIVVRQTQFLHNPTSTRSHRSQLEVVSFETTSQKVDVEF